MLYNERTLFSTPRVMPGEFDAISILAAKITGLTPISFK